jgi:hypothetical protein
MPLQNLDETKLLILMAAGGFICLAGLILLFRPKRGEDATDLQAFGLKFKTSSAGLVVFVVGAAFMVAPVFVPERPVREQPAPAPLDGGRRIPLPQRAADREVEPNDVVQEANEIAIGPLYAGRVSGGDVDWYAVGVDDQHDELVLKIKSVSANGYCYAYAKVFDMNERDVGWLPLEQDLGGAARTSIGVGANKIFFLKVYPSGSNSIDYCGYELSLSYADE